EYEYDESNERKRNESKKLYMIARYWLPLLLTYNFSEIITMEKIVDHPEINASSSYQLPEEDLTEEQKNIVNLLPLINKLRFNNEVFWKEIGMSIYNTFDGSNIGYKLWTKYHPEYNKSNLSLGEERKNKFDIGETSTDQSTCDDFLDDDLLDQLI